jgi:hypothetical protein
MLTDEQWAVLGAAIDRIIPSDDFPGGCEAGVIDYLRGQLGRDLSDHAGIYRAGLNALDAEALASGNAGFAALGADAQDSLLARVEQGDTVTAWPVDAAGFFAMLVDHVMEGFYGDPGNGGNHDAVSWKMVGFEVHG